MQLPFKINFITTVQISLMAPVVDPGGGGGGGGGGPRPSVFFSSIISMLALMSIVYLLSV